MSDENAKNKCVKRNEEQIRIWADLVVRSAPPKDPLRVYYPPHNHHINYAQDIDHLHDATIKLDPEVYQRWVHTIYTDDVVLTPDEAASDREHSVSGEKPSANHIRTFLLSSCELISRAVTLRSSSRSIVRPPGLHLGRMAEFLFSKKTNERVFLPVIRDLQEEYLEALADSRIRKARWVWLRGHIAFWKAFAMQIPVSLVKLVVTIWKAAD